MTPEKTPEEAGHLANLRAQIAATQIEGANTHPDFTSEEIAKALQDNEAGDAELVKKAMEDLFVLDVKRNQFYRFQDGSWQKDLENESMAFAGRVLKEAYETEAKKQQAKMFKDGASETDKKNAATMHEMCKKRLSKINTLRRLQSVLKLATTGLSPLVITGDEWNANPYLLQAKNQVIYLNNGFVRQGQPKDYINKVAPTEWQGLMTPAPKWEEFLCEVFDGNKELVEYIQRALGAALLGKPTQQEFYILWGEGRNGKGTILETLKKVLGDNLAGSVKSEMIIETRQGSKAGADPELLDLQGKRIVWTSETGEGKKLNTEKIKLFSGGDTLSGRLNYSNEIIRFNPTHTLFVLTNHKPRIGSDTAIWDRLRLIPFNVRFVDEPELPNERPKDTELQNKLLQEAPGILAWMVHGCRWFLDIGLKPPQIVKEAGSEYRLDEDYIRQFVQEACELGKEYQSYTQPLYDAFTEWYKETYGERARVISLKKFSNKLETYPGVERETADKSKARKTIFHGICPALVISDHKN